MWSVDGLMLRATAIAFALLLAGCAAPTPAAGDTTPTETTVTNTPCDFALDMSDPAAVERFRVVLDGVMGGKSTGTRYFESGEGQDGHMVFRGAINTDGGGFSSMRMEVEQGRLSGARALRLRLRPDGRAYQLRFRTSERFRGRSVSYGVAIPATPPGEWAEVEVPLEDFTTTIFGRTVPAAPFEAADVRELGIILADGVDGPFRLEVARVECVG